MNRFTLSGAVHVTAHLRDRCFSGSRKLLFHEETLSSAERTQFALTATAQMRETLCAILWEVRRNIDQNLNHIQNLKV